MERPGHLALSEGSALSSPDEANVPPPQAYDRSGSGFFYVMAANKRPKWEVVGCMCKKQSRRYFRKQSAIRETAPKNVFYSKGIAYNVVFWIILEGVILRISRSIKEVPVAKNL